jgi:NAD-dependent dihydropyrimidine dehydrogenase PreA subunit
MEKRRKPIIIDKTADGLLEAAESCPHGCFSIKGTLIFVAKPYNCQGCGMCESITTGIKVEEK